MIHIHDAKDRDDALMVRIEEIGAGDAIGIGLAGSELPRRRRTRRARARGETDEMETKDARVGTRGTNGKTTTTTTTRRPMSERTVVEGAGRRLVVVAAVAVVLAGVCAALARIGTRFAGGLSDALAG